MLCVALAKFDCTSLVQERAISTPESNDIPTFRTKFRSLDHSVRHCLSPRASEALGLKIFSRTSRRDQTGRAIIGGSMLAFIDLIRSE